MTDQLSDIEVLTEAIALVEREEGWCQGAYCQDAQGQQIFSVRECSTGWGYLLDRSTAPPPARFCLEGAIRYAAGYFTSFTSSPELDFEIVAQCQRLENLVAIQWGRAPLHIYNDDQDTTQEDAVLALKRTLADLEEEL